MRMKYRDVIVGLLLLSFQSLFETALKDLSEYQKQRAAF